MKKVSVLVLALFTMMAVSGVAANAAKKKERVASKVKLKFKPGPVGEPPYYEEAVFKGKVGTKGRASGKAKRKCKRRREVVIKQLRAGRFGQTRTNRRGKYELSASGVYNAPGRYQAKVKRTKLGKIICKAAKSKPVNAF